MRRRKSSLITFLSCSSSSCWRRRHCASLLLHLLPRKVALPRLGTRGDGPRHVADAADVIIRVAALQQKTQRVVRLASPHGQGCGCPGAIQHLSDEPPHLGVILVERSGDTTARSSSAADAAATDAPAGHHPALTTLGRCPREFTGGRRSRRPLALPRGSCCRCPCCHEAERRRRRTQARTALSQKLRLQQVLAPSSSATDAGGSQRL
jgi:hypothetical protein